MTKLLRAVFDTNVFIAAYRSQNPRSPARELLSHWRTGELILLYSRLMQREYVHQLEALNIDQSDVAKFYDDIARLGVRIPIRSKQIKPVTNDPKDDMFVACAVIGQATHLVSYDPHILNLGESYRGVKILEPLPFLQEVRDN